jgi:hypothetical protein
MMTSMNFKTLPYMHFADSNGRIYDHPYYRMAGFSGSHPEILQDEDLIPMPEFSKLFFIPGCPPVGLNPATGQHETIREVKVGGSIIPCQAVAAFLEPGIVRSHLPATDFSTK